MALRNARLSLFELCSPNGDFARPNKPLFSPSEHVGDRTAERSCSVFSKHVSRVWVHDLGDDSSKSASKRHDGFPKIQTHAITWRGVAFVSGLVRLVLCKILARWVYQNTNARDDMTRRCFVSDWCVWFFVKYWQDGFTKSFLAIFQRCEY